MNTRYDVNPVDAKRYDTDSLRKSFLIDDLFTDNEIRFTYCHADRIIVGSACPKETLYLKGGKELGSEYFLERRELGIINIGAEGYVTLDGEKYTLGNRDGLYVGKGVKDVEFDSVDKDNLAKFYLVSTPAHKKYPTTKIKLDETEPQHLGSLKESNERTIHKYIHPNGCQSCQLVMGMTLLDENNVWNTMPCHTHDRRMEVYLYFDMKKDDMVFHLMGEPEETRHIVMRNEQAVISPSWSIHSGVGTSNYTFIWAMAGENQTFSDMDHVKNIEVK